MGMSFKVAPGVRIRASSRGISAGVGPRAARVHVGTRGVGVSSGVGPVSGYTHLGGGCSGPTEADRRYGGPTKASIAAREREAEGGRARSATSSGSSASKERSSRCTGRAFPPPQRTLSAAARGGRPDRSSQTSQRPRDAPAADRVRPGGGEEPPIAADPEPVDRYELMREHRKERPPGSRSGGPRPHRGGPERRPRSRGGRRSWRRNGGLRPEPSSRIGSTVSGASSEARGEGRE